MPLLLHEICNLSDDPACHQNPIFRVTAGTNNPPVTIYSAFSPLICCPFSFGLVVAVVVDVELFMIPFVLWFFAPMVPLVTSSPLKCFPVASHKSKPA